MKPDWKVKKGRPRKHKFYDMQVGETRTLELGDTSVAAIRTSIYMAGKKHGMKFYTRVDPDNKQFQIFRGE